MKLGNLENILDNIKQDKKESSQNKKNKGQKKKPGSSLDSVFNRINENSQKQSDKDKQTNPQSFLNKNTAKSTEINLDNAINQIIEKGNQKNTNNLQNINNLPVQQKNKTVATGYKPVATGKKQTNIAKKNIQKIKNVKQTAFEPLYRKTIKRYLISTKEYFDRIKENEKSYNTKKIVLKEDFQKQITKSENKLKYDLDQLDKQFSSNCKDNDLKKQNDLNVLQNEITKYNDNIKVIIKEIESEVTGIESELTKVNLMKYIKRIKNIQSTTTPKIQNMPKDTNPKDYVLYLSNCLQQIKKEKDNIFIDLSNLMRYRRKRAIVIKILLSLLFLSSLFSLWPFIYPMIEKFF